MKIHGVFLVDVNVFEVEISIVQIRSIEFD